MRSEAFGGRAVPMGARLSLGRLGIALDWIGLVGWLVVFWGQRIPGEPDQGKVSRMVLS